MKYLLIALLCLFCSISIDGQTLKFKRIGLQQGDLLAQKEPRNDDDGNKCAVIRFDVVGVLDLKFKEAVGDVTYSDNEYIVYVPNGTKTLSYSSKQYTGILDIEGNGIEIESGMTYRVILKSSQCSVIFYVNPSDSKVLVGEQFVPLDKSGKGMINLSEGEYSFSITASHYQSEAGVLQIPEDENHMTKQFNLEPVLYNVNYTCTQPMVSLFVDDKPFGKLGSFEGTLQLSAGKHSIRTTKPGFKTYQRKVVVPNSGKVLRIKNPEIKEKIIKHTEERTKSSISLRKHWNFLGFAISNVNDGFKSLGGKVAFEGHQYVGRIAFKEGLGLGAFHGSDGYIVNIDKYRDEVIADSANNFAFQIDIPLQMGFALPLSKYNTSQVSFLAGFYGQMYYIGQKSRSMITNRSVSTYKFDMGLRGNIEFYFHKFSLSFEISHALLKKELGTFVGIGAGIRLY